MWLIVLRRMQGCLVLLPTNRARVISGVNSTMPGATLAERQQRLWMTEAYEAEILANQALS